MMTVPLPTLTVGNLTATPIELMLYEQPVKSEETAGGVLGAVAKTISSLWSAITGPSTANPEVFTTHEVSIKIDPFEAKKTKILDVSGKILRIIFQADGLQYLIETPKQAWRPTILKPLSPGPHPEFTAIRLPKASHISIFSSASLDSWMSKLKDDIPLSAVSIPGTHNSPTCYTALPSVRCQAVGIEEQLANGVRFLDIRVQPEYPDDPTKDELILVHSAFPISLTGNKYFRDLIRSVYRFLDANPDETVIVSLKREGVGKSTDQQLSRILYDHYTCDQKRWFTENRIPVLREVRGKVVLIRRFILDDSLRGANDGQGWAIDAETWPDNCPDGMCPSGDIVIQDFYDVAQVSDIKRK